MTIATTTGTRVTGWAVGTVPADPFSALPDNGEDVDLMAAPPAPRDTADQKRDDRDYAAREDAVTRVLGLLRQTDMSADQRKPIAEAIVTAVDLAREPVDPDTVGFDDDPNCPCIDGRCSCTSDSTDYRD